MLSMSVWDIVPEPQWEAHRARLARILNGEALDDTFEYEVRDKAGNLLPAEVRSAPYRKGDILGFQAIARNIQERKRAEEALHESEARFRSLFDNSPIGIYRTTPAGEILDTNPALLAMLGYATLDELRRRNLEDTGFQPNYPRAKFKETIERDGRVRGLEARWKRKDGTELVVRENAQAVRSVDGTVLYYEGAVEDVTERTRAEEARRRLAAAVDQAAEAVMVTDAAGAIEYVNPAFERITGYTRDEAIGRNPRLLKSGRHDERFYRELWATITAGQPWKGHLVDRRKDGTFYEEEATISPVRDEHGVISNFVAVARDVTHEVALQQQLDHAQRIEAIGRLAGGIAHDFNNLLQAILSQLAVLELRLRGTAGAQKPLDEVSQLVRRGAALTRQLLLFARRGTASREPLDLNQVVEGAATLLRRVVRENVAVVTELSGEPLLVLADHGQLDQVLMNLAVNASDAMPEGGRLTLRTAGDASRVRLSVTDTGAGSRRRCAPTCSSRSSPPRGSAREPGSASRWCTASSPPTAGRSRSPARPRRARRSPSCCRARPRRRSPQRRPAPSRVKCRPAGASACCWSRTRTGPGRGCSRSSAHSATRSRRPRAARRRARSRASRGTTCCSPTSCCRGSPAPISPSGCARAGRSSRS